MEWNDDLKIGVEKIDQQHQEFFRQRDKFSQASQKVLKEKGDTSQAREELEDLFYFLTDYFVTHFKDEEEMQKKHNYPDYELHKQQHEEFVDKVNQLKYQFLQQDKIDCSLIVQLKEKVTDWFIHHIAEEDTDIADYIEQETTK